MKNRIFKNACRAFISGGLMLSIASCEKNKLAPTAQPSVSGNNSVTSIMASYNPVYGVSSNGNFYTVDPASGNQTSVKQMIYDGGLPVMGATGVAKYPDAAYPNRFTVSATGTMFCGVGSGTAFFFVYYDAYTTTATAVRLGYLPGRTIKDIEYNPVDGFLYGIEGSNIVKVLSLGSACMPGDAGTTPTVVTLGVPSSVGIGPYSLAFNWAGQCNVVSATDHYRAIVDLNTMAVSSGTRYQGMTTNMVNPQELGFCISKLSLLMATNDKPTSTTYDLSYYQFATSGVVGSWIEQSDNCLVDYTSKPENTTVIK